MHAKVDIIFVLCHSIFLCIKYSLSSWFSVKLFGVTDNALSLDSRTRERERLSKWLMLIARNILNRRYHHPSFFLYVTATATRLRHSRHLDARSQFLGDEELSVSASRFILDSISHPSLSSALSQPPVPFTHLSFRLLDITPGSFYVDDLYRDPRINYSSTACIMDLSLLFHR